MGQGCALLFKSVFLCKAKKVSNVYIECWFIANKLFMLHMYIYMIHYICLDVGHLPTEKHTFWEH